MSSDSDRIPDLYERHAASWAADRSASAWVEKPWFVRFCGMLPAFAAVLDLGCGSGAPIARHLAAAGLCVTGVDTSPTLIAMCRQRLPGHEWLVADMRGLTLGRRFAGVLAWDSFFHLAHDDQRRMFDVFVRHAAPAGILMFNTGPRHGEAVGTYRGEALYHASLAPDEYTRRLHEAGFGVLAHVTEDPGAGGRTIWLARHGAAP